jgi:hypothetical protein
MAHQMTTKERAMAARTEKHRKTHKLIQTWVSPELWELISAKAKKEKRPLANLVRCDLEKIYGIDE